MYSTNQVMTWTPYKKRRRRREKTSFGLRQKNKGPYQKRMMHLRQSSAPNSHRILASGKVVHQQGFIRLILKVEILNESQFYTSLYNLINKFPRPLL